MLEVEFGYIALLVMIFWSSYGYIIVQRQGFLLFIMVLEVLPVEVRSGYPEELLFDDHLALAIKSL